MARTRKYTCGKHFSKHHGAAHTVTARARRNKIDKVRDTFSGRAHAPTHTPNYTNIHHSTVVLGHAERPVPEQYLRMTITLYGGSAIGRRVVCGRAGRWMGGWAAPARQVSRAHAIPQGSGR